MAFFFYHQRTTNVNIDGSNRTRAKYAQTVPS